MSRKEVSKAPAQKLIEALPPFAKNSEWARKDCKEILTQIENDIACIENHKGEEGIDESLRVHLYNAHVTLERLTMLVASLYHREVHVLEVRKDLSEVRQEFMKHKPKLDFIDKQVEEAIKRDEEGQHIYA